MAHRHNHYEAAFEDYARSRGWPYVPVDEQRKAVLAGARIKSFDYVVYRPRERAWLVDVKGRKFPYDTRHGRRFWENWVTRQDLAGLRQWEGVFGDDFEPVFVFVYWIVGLGDHDPTGYTHVFRDRRYALTWVSVSDYAVLARRRSPSWDTVDVPVREFRRLLHPLQRA